MVKSPGMAISPDGRESKEEAQYREQGKKRGRILFVNPAR
jgi:hypothetical protein